jgi:membrane-associated phospholipid phosphatase
MPRARRTARLEGVNGGRHPVSARGVAREIGVIAVAALAYFGVRGSTEERIGSAFDNADRIVRAERELGIAWEEGIQAAIVDHEWLVRLTNWVYVYGHWPVIAACGVALFVWRRDRYVLLRNAMFVSGLLGFAFFAGFPVAPPRLADPAVVDTVTEYSEGYRALQPPALTNKYAAFPSLHAGWNLLVGIVLFQATRRLAVRAFAVAMPVAMAFAVVATANHYVLDVVGGTVLILLGYFTAKSLSARTMSATRGRSQRRARPSASSPIRRRAPFGQLARRPADGGGARRPSGRSGCSPLPEAPRGAPPEDPGADSDPLGPVAARQPVRSTTRRRRPPRGLRRHRRARARSEGA